MDYKTSLEVLSQATQPQAAGRIDRAGYSRIEQTLAWQEHEFQRLYDIEAKYDALNRPDVKT